MTTWCHLPTTIKRLLARSHIVLGWLVVAFITTLFISHTTFAATPTSRTVNFQGRLLTPAGAAVPDGHYNMQFKIYDGGQGTSAGDPGGSLDWTENYLTGSIGGGVDVSNGYFSVALGSHTSFGSSINWDSPTLFLSMDIAGTGTCTTFGSSSCPADGEMLPMKAIGATPYSLDSGALDGKTAGQFLQLGQGVQTDGGSASSIFINKTGSGSLIQLQNDGQDVFSVANTGDLTLGGGSDKAITLSQAASNTTGGNLTISGGSGGSNANGGGLALSGGTSGSGDANGGNITLSGGAGSGTGSTGLVILGTPTFQTTTDDPGCYPNSAPATKNCTVAQSSVDNSSAIMVGISTDAQTATLPDPTNKTAGRILYIIASSDSHPFTLSASENAVAMQPNTALALIWSGTSWALVNGTGAPTSTPSSSTLAPTNETGQTLQSQNTDQTTSQTPAKTTKPATSTPAATSDQTATFTIPTSDNAPDASSNSLSGSMYYNPTLGKLQCYHNGNWGNCTDTPDSFVSLSPEYQNAVMNGTDIGTISSDICSDSLGINNGTNNQPAICGKNETYNYYQWTSDQKDAQTRSIFVTYQLPGNFKKFVAGSLSLTGRTDSNNAKVSYRIYRDNHNTNNGLQACGTDMTVTTSNNAWQKQAATDKNDPANCGFQPGDSMLVRIDLTASQNANAFVSNLDFVYHNQ
ncbi:MAG TPA: hypothetical protein VFQ70_03235 [Candidatus Saccharimonadaceae bacterium]|nr:hypothetical protein [Candidatus Saccharimonadaceae bacterium]